MPWQALLLHSTNITHPPTHQPTHQPTPADLYRPMPAFPCRYVDSTKTAMDDVREIEARITGLKCKSLVQMGILDSGLILALFLGGSCAMCPPICHHVHSYRCSSPGLPVSPSPGLPVSRSPRLHRCSSWCSSCSSVRNLRCCGRIFARSFSRSGPLQCLVQCGLLSKNRKKIEGVKAFLTWA